MDDNQTQRKWYKKKRYIIPLAVIGFVVAVNAVQQSPSNPSTSKLLPTNEQTAPQGGIKLVPQDETITLPSKQTPAAQLTAPTPTPASSQSSEPKYYINSSGNTVQSPVQADSRPEGASARCRDNSYSFSQHRSGTCSHHGGVAQWY